MVKKKQEEELTVIVRNASGTRIRYPDGRVEGHVSISAERHAMVVEGINRIRREAAMKENAKAI